jgi:hypothetical protein
MLPVLTKNELLVELSNGQTLLYQSEKKIFNAIIQKK